MLKAIVIENFKAFGSCCRVELAPITLIFGENSAGKSSLLQALNLLKQTHESRESGAPLLPRAEDGIVDLGSFRALLFDHDVRRTLRIGLEIASDEGRQARSRWHRLMGNTEQVPIGITFAFGLGVQSQELGLHGFDVALESLRSKFASFTIRPLSDPEQSDIYRIAWNIARGRRLGRRQRMLGAECQWVSDSTDTWDPIFRAWLNRRDEIYKWLSEARDQLSRQLRLALSPADEDLTRDRERDLDAAYSQALSFYSRPFGVQEFVGRMTRAWKGTVLGMDGFLPITGGTGGRPVLPELNLIDSRTTSREALSLPTNDVGGIAFLAGRLVEETLDSLFPMGPFRRPPERWYIFTGTSPKDVGYRGDHLPDLLYRRPDLVENANHWLAQLHIGYSLQVRSIGEQESDLFELRLLDTRRTGTVEVGLSDVGFGVSQLLPFIVQTLASARQLISIEQPEIHIHPRLQADLGELLAEGIRAPFNHQFLIETHSEHLVLRLQKLIRLGRLSPQEVSIIFVERGPQESRAQRLHLDDHGAFINEWPGGFFPERLRELM